MKTIVGTWHDTRGNLAAWGKLHLVLNQDAHVILTAQVAPRSMTFSLDQNGSLMAGSKVWANDELDPPGTYYTATVTAAGGGVIWGPQWVVIAGFDPVDLTSIVPLRMIPPINQFSTSTTPPVFAMGVSDTPVSSELGFDPNAFMTVSDELILAPGANVLFSGSRSQHSMTVTINAIGGGGTGTGGGAAFTAGIAGTNLSGAGTTVSNQLLIAGGSNITISRTTNAAGMTMSILGLSQGTGQSFQAALTGGGTVGAGGPVSNRLYLAGGNNVTLSGNTNANGMTVTINGEPQGTPSAPGGAVSLIEGANITINSIADAAGTTATIYGASGGGGGSFLAGISGGNTSGNTGMVSGRLVLAGGANITLSGATNAGSATVTVSGNPWPTLSLLSTPNGTIQGASNVSLSSFRLAAGSNILLAQSGNSITINALATGGTATGGGGGAVSLVPGANISITQDSIAGVGTTATVDARGGVMSLVEGNNITISHATNASGTTATINAGQSGNTNVALSAFHIATGTGGTISGNTAAPIGFSVLQLNAGRNMFFSGVSSATGFSVGMHALSRNVYAGPGIEISTSSNSLGASTTITNVGGAGGGSVAITGLHYLSTASFTNASGTQFGFTGESGGGGSGSFGVGLSSGGAGSTAGNSAQTLQNAALRLVAGSNVTLSGATNANQHMTVTINAGGAGTGGGSPFWAGIHTSLESVITLGGTQWGSTSGNVGPVSNGVSLAAGANVTLIGATNQSGQMITIRVPKPFSIVANTVTGGGSFAGATFNVTNGLFLFAGSNITFSANQTTSMGNGGLTINAPNPFGVGITAGAGSTAGNTGASLLTGGLRLAAGSNVTLSGATNAASAMTITINAGGGGAATVANSRSLGPIIPLLPANITQGTFVKNSVLFWPIQPMGLGSNFTAAVLPMDLVIGTSGIMRGSLGISLGVYTRNGSTLSQAGVTQSSWSFSTSGGMVAAMQYQGWRNLVVPWSHHFNSAEDHWMAIRVTTAHSTYQSFDVQAIIYQAAPIPLPWGVGPLLGSGYQAIPGWGFVNSTTLPTSLAMSLLNTTGENLDIYMNTPAFFFAGFSV